MDRIFRRGQVWWVDCTSNVGHEQKGVRRPAIIVSNNKCNKNSAVVEVVYLTTKAKKPLPTHACVYAHVPSIALCEMVDSVDKSRIYGHSPIATIYSDEMEKVDNALKISLGLEGGKE